MTAIESALKAIDREKALDHGNYVPPVYVFCAVNERNATDPFSYGYEMFLLGIAKGRRMVKIAQKKKKSFLLKSCTMTTVNLSAAQITLQTSTDCWI